MRTPRLFSTIALSAYFAAGLASAAGIEDAWYSGLRPGFWGLSESVGWNTRLPGMSNFPGASLESLRAQRQYGGYRISNAFAIEGTQMASIEAACADVPGGSARTVCSGAAWSLSGVATLPFQSGLSVFGRLGLHYQHQPYSNDGNGQDPASEQGAINTLYGIGMNYDLTKSITFHAESERYSELTGRGKYLSDDGLRIDSSVHSIGLSIKF